MSLKERAVGWVGDLNQTIVKHPARSSFLLLGVFSFVLGFFLHPFFQIYGLLLIGGLLSCISILIVGSVLFIFNIASIAIVLLESREEPDEAEFDEQQILERRWFRRALLRYTLGAGTWAIICVLSLLIFFPNFAFLAGAYLVSLCTIFWLMPSYDNPFLRDNID
jgi:hypothetical protein